MAPRLPARSSNTGRSHAERVRLQWRLGQARGEADAHVRTSPCERAVASVKTARELLQISSCTDVGRRASEYCAHVSTRLWAVQCALKHTPGSTSEQVSPTAAEEVGPHCFGVVRSQAHALSRRTSIRACGDAGAWRCTGTLWRAQARGGGSRLLCSTQTCRRAHFGGGIAVSSSCPSLLMPPLWTAA